MRDSGSLWKVPSSHPEVSDGPRKSPGWEWEAGPREEEVCCANMREDRADAFAKLEPTFSANQTRAKLPASDRMPTTIPYHILHAVRRGVNAVSERPPPGALQAILAARHENRDWVPDGEQACEFFAAQAITLATLLEVPLSQFLFLTLGYLSSAAGGCTKWLMKLLEPAEAEITKASEPGDRLHWAVRNHKEYAQKRQEAWLEPAQGTFAPDFATHEVLSEIRKHQEKEKVVEVDEESDDEFKAVASIFHLSRSLTRQVPPLPTVASGSGFLHSPFLLVSSPGLRRSSHTPPPQPYATYSSPVTPRRTSPSPGRPQFLAPPSPLPLCLATLARSVPSSPIRTPLGPISVFHQNGATPRLSLFVRLPVETSTIKGRNSRPRTPAAEEEIEEEAVNQKVIGASRTRTSSNGSMIRKAAEDTGGTGGCTSHAASLGREVHDGANDVGEGTPL
ncbi:hypothetical protein B0H17DRAFT_1131717 [Mycena rosella]|uniref:Uncharacterized protein n=1 Tax=Mycena rosella TaxID=1033263 RepID=A0AAD7DLT0_MYCRO|nr:hypothetical protein B0H17DRAFT_1131717 [Mycena rosella]